MAKYWQVIQLGIQNTLVYRTNFFFRSVFSLIPLVAIISLWRTVYQGKGGMVSGYGIDEMICYYLLVTVVDALTSVTEDDWQIASDIKDGNISQFLTRPLDYMSYRLCLFLSGRMIYVVASFIPLVLFVGFHHSFFRFPVDSGTWALFAVSLVFSALLQFFSSFALAMLAFWVMEISSFVFVLLALQRLAGGQMFPLDILPGWGQRILLLTPFPYQGYFPASIYLGKVSGPALWEGLAAQFFWVVAAYFLARGLWSRGVKGYTAAGG